MLLARLAEKPSVVKEMKRHASPSQYICVSVAYHLVETGRLAAAAGLACEACSKLVGIGIEWCWMFPIAEAWRSQAYRGQGSYIK